MSFMTLPPEINSLLMYSGAGAGPMLQAAAAWNGLSAELGSAAESFSSVLSGLAGQAWQGAASRAMTSAAAPYLGWLSAAASQASGAATQAQAVASEFETALAATVHPLAVQANRNGLVQLVMSNLFGQNWPAIAAAEGYYEEMWAQDVSAMLGYHGGALAAATQLTSGVASMPAIPSLPGVPAGGMGASSTSTGGNRDESGSAGSGSVGSSSDPGGVGQPIANVGVGGAALAAATGGGNVGARGLDNNAVVSNDTGITAGNAMGNANVSGVNIGAASPRLVGAAGMTAMMAAATAGSAAPASTAQGRATQAPEAAALVPEEAVETPAAEPEETVPATATPLSDTPAAAVPAAAISAPQAAAAETRPEGEMLALATPAEETPAADDRARPN